MTGSERKQAIPNKKKAENDFIYCDQCDEKIGREVVYHTCDMCFDKFLHQQCLTLYRAQSGMNAFHCKTCIDNMPDDYGEYDDEVD